MLYYFQLGIIFIFVSIACMVFFNSNVNYHKSWLSLHLLINKNNQNLYVVYICANEMFLAYFRVQMTLIYLWLPRTRNALTMILFALKVFWYQLGTPRSTSMTLLTNRLVNSLLYDYPNLHYWYRKQIVNDLDTSVCM